MKALHEVLLNINPVYVIISVIAQHAFAMLWFGCIVNYLDRYYMAADKGVRRFEFALQRYSQLTITLACLVCATIRAIVFITLINTYRGSTIMDYECAAIVTAVIAMIPKQRHFACQRPIQLLITEDGFEIGAPMVVAMSVCIVSFVEEQAHMVISTTPVTITRSPWTKCDRVLNYPDRRAYDTHMHT